MKQKSAETYGIKEFLIDLAIFYLVIPGVAYLTGLWMYSNHEKGKAHNGAGNP